LFCARRALQPAGKPLLLGTEVQSTSITRALASLMHITRTDLVQTAGAEGETILSYPTATQPDVRLSSLPIYRVLPPRLLAQLPRSPLTRSGACCVQVQSLERFQIRTLAVRSLSFAISLSLFSAWVCRVCRVCLIVARLFSFKLRFHDR
jgi:hypothetical protein